MREKRCKERSTKNENEKKGVGGQGAETESSTCCGNVNAPRLTDVTYFWVAYCVNLIVLKYSKVVIIPDTV